MEKMLKEVKKNIDLSLERLGLSQFVSLEEIEREISQSETPLQSFLLLGILRRILAREDNKTAELFIPAITEWKNHLPHEDLGGLTPFEYREKYPPGKYEMNFIAGMMEEYQSRLQSLEIKEEESFNVHEDFKLFQEKYLKRLPVEQPEGFEKFKNLKEIIVEERHRNGYPKKDIDKIGAHIFAENTAEGTGRQIAEIENDYHDIINELAALQVKRSQNSERRIKKIYSFLKKFEPYFRCALEPHSFYLNYASVLLLVDKVDQSLEMLDKALSYKPDYQLAQKMKDQVLGYISSN